MTGPVTLFAQPHYNRYFDADGEHAIPWVSDQSLAGVPRDTDSKVIDSVPVALSNYIPFGGYRKNYTPIPASIAGFSDAWTWLTVTGGTKAYKYPNDAYLQGSVVEYLATYESGLRGSGARLAGTRFSVGLDVAASASPMSFSMVAPSDLPNYLTVEIVLSFINLANATRTFRFTRNGTPTGRTYSIPARTWATIKLQAIVGVDFASSDVVGVLASDIVIGEKLYLAYFAIHDGGGSVAPIPTDVSNISTVQEDNDIGEWPVIVPWAGTPRQSVAEEGTRYWKIAVNRNHFPNELEGEIVSRWMPYGWPITSDCAPISLERKGVYGYSESGVPPWNPLYHPAGFWFMNNGAKSGGITGPINMIVDAEWNEYPSPIGTDTIGDTAGSIDIYDDKVVGLVVPDSPWQEFMLASIRWNSERVIMENDGNVFFDKIRTNPVGRDFPFMGMEPTEYGDPDAVYLSATIRQSEWSNSLTWNRDVAVFNRNLTTSERAFVSDPDSFWNLNMFAEPKTALVTGLTGSLYQGDTAQVLISIKDADNIAVPLYGHTIWWTIKYQGDDEPNDDTAVEQLTGIFAPDGTNTGTGITAVDLSNGLVAATFSLPDQSCKYDIQVEDVNGHIHTIGYGTFNVLADVTKES